MGITVILRHGAREGSTGVGANMLTAQASDALKDLGRKLRELSGGRPIRIITSDQLIARKSAVALSMGISPETTAPRTLKDDASPLLSSRWDSSEEEKERGMQHIQEREKESEFLVVITHFELAERCLGYYSGKYQSTGWPDLLRPGEAVIVDREAGTVQVHTLK